DATRIAPNTAPSAAVARLETESRPRNRAAVDTSKPPIPIQPAALSAVKPERKPHQPCRVPAAAAKAVRAARAETASPPTDRRERGRIKASVLEHRLRPVRKLAELPQRLLELLVVRVALEAAHHFVEAGHHEQGEQGRDEHAADDGDGHRDHQLRARAAGERL